MKTIWTAGLEDDEAGIMRGDFLSAHLLRRRLDYILKEKIRAHNSVLHSKKNYENPSWPYSVADSIGYMRALEEVCSLISDEGDKPVIKRPRGRPRKPRLTPLTTNPAVEK